ncbi:type II toxin-antitoxin system HipA family toxin YjjJ [bacterium]|nr:type II toxin-antitoxin system HipA family toxin YjjJ [bacterium]
MQELFEKLVKYLSKTGPSKAKDLCAVLNISQPTFSKLLAQNSKDILRIGKGINTLYAIYRKGTWNYGEILSVPLFVVDKEGNQSVEATLHPLAPQGFYLESHGNLFKSRVYKNLPYFLLDACPSGFLGRLVPKFHSEFPTDISLWTDDHCLTYFCRYGWDLIGNFIIGDEAYNLHLQHQVERTDIVDENNRNTHYPAVADKVLSQGNPGSSAGGEQAKFLSIRKTSSQLMPVMVKFSPPVDESVGLRVADLLICEHIAHQVLKKIGKNPLQSCLIRGGGRVFLEVERFDRMPYENYSGGRLGLISLKALAMEHGCLHSTWMATAQALLSQKIMDASLYDEIIWLEVFGKLIGNNDMHAGNISFLCEGEKLAGLAPVYDMLPMSYAPLNNQLINRDFTPDPPKSLEIKVWKEALKAAQFFWEQVENHPEISKKFKEVVAGNSQKLLELGKIKVAS